MSIERKAISALKWATAAKFVSQIVSWAGTLVVVRLLTPEDYGLMAKVSVVCAIAAAIAEFGLEAAIVRWAELAREDLRKLYGVSLLFGAAITLIVAASAPLFAFLFHEPRMTWPVACASLQIVIASLAVVPSALWTRELNFQPLAKIEMVVGIVSIAVTVLLAYLGMGVWSLVLGLLAGAVVRSTALLAFGEHVSPLFSVRGIGEQLKFGLTLASGRISYIALIQSDIMIGSAFLSTIQIGRYSVALQLATLPMTKVMGTINQIMLPAVARQQDDLPRARQNLFKSISLVATVAFPVLWGLSAVAPELVQVLFGSKWLEIVPALMILPLIVPVRMVSNILYTTSLALGNRALELRNTIINFLVLPTGFFVGAHWGLIGLCLAWLVAVPLAYSFTVRGVARFVGVRISGLLAECAAPAAASAIMYAAVAALRLVLDGWPPVLALVTLIVTGALVYFAVLALISRRHLVSALSFSRTMLTG